MKIRKQPIFAGRFVNLLVPESREEFNQLAGAKENEDPALDLAVDHIVYHVQLGKIRPGVVAEVLKLREEQAKSETGTQIPERAVTGQGPKRKDGKPNPVHEKDSLYIKKVLASKSISDPDFQAILQSVADANPFNPAESEGGTVAKKFFTYADGVIAAIEGGQGTWAKFLENFGNQNPDFEFELEDGVPTRDSLAAAFKHDETRTLRESQEKIKGFVA